VTLENHDIRTSHPDKENQSRKTSQWNGETRRLETSHPDKENQIGKTSHCGKENQNPLTGQQN
jgi:hypothetical protein